MTRRRGRITAGAVDVLSDAPRKPRENSQRCDDGQGHEVDRDANRTVPPRAKQRILWDTRVTGLGLRVLDGGSKTFWFQYRPHPGGRSVSSRMIRIGPWPTTTLAAARKAAAGFVGEVAKGKDPAACHSGRRAGKSQPGMIRFSTAARFLAAICVWR